jgi:hypothetical protein
MKKILKSLLLFSALMMSYSALAYNGKPVDEQCKKPRFDRFSLPTYKASERIEVAPESEFSFRLSSKVAAETLKITIKKKAVKYTIENKNSFYLITSKIPAEYTGKFVRINTSVTAKLDCKGRGGWLIKVADAKVDVKAEPEVIVETKSTAKSDCEEE